MEELGGINNINEGFSEINLIEKRKEKIANFLKKQKDWIYYLILGFIVLLSVYIRTRNIPKLKDIATGTWTLGPDLDPFLFLRWAQYIVEHGKLMAVDTMRYVPLGFNTANEKNLLPYLIAWFHKFISFFSLSDSVTYSAIIFPVFMAALTAVAFFLFVRKIFDKEDRKIANTIALIATLFFVLVPSLLPRTIAGIPEKESAAFFFMFMALYLFLRAFDSENIKKGILFGILAGITTGLMALTWGGYTFVIITIASAILISFTLGKVKWKEFTIYSSWLFSTIIVVLYFSEKYTLKGLISSPYTSLSIVVFIIVGLSLIFMKQNILSNLHKKTKPQRGASPQEGARLPKEIFYLILSILILITIVSVIFGPNFIINQIKGVENALITPMTTRFGLTVAENKQPYFVDWRDSFGPLISDMPIIKDWAVKFESLKLNIPIFFWLFFIGSISMFYHLINKLNKKEKIILTFGYFIFLVCLIFSRYAPHPNILDGEGNLSLLMYFWGMVFFLGCLFNVYYKRYKKGENDIFKEFNFDYIIYFILFLISIIGARGGVRLIMVLGAVSPIAISFMIVKIAKKAIKEKEDTKNLLFVIFAIILLIASVFTLWEYYKQDKYTAENFAPTIYSFQWQKAMQWVREDTPANSVFSHWWDYGYWIQSIGERATILDGSNSIIYWNYLMGRYVLTGQNEKDALEFLYSHNGTHLLIDSTDIGKYTAYSSIGSDENYDRFSWISTFIIDESKTQETKNETSYIYTGGSLVDEDIAWENNKIFLPAKKAVVAAVILEIGEDEKIHQPKAIFVYQNQQYRIPLRYAYYDDKLYDFGTGLDAGIFIYPKVSVNQQNQLNINKIGALLYLSKKTIHSNLANLYLFDKQSDNFKLVHTESNLIIEDIRKQEIDFGEFVQYQGFQGPIKIWEINYPKDIKFNQEYLEKKYPNEELRLAKGGEY